MEKTSNWETFDDFLAEELKDPKFRKEYEALQPQYELISSMIKARNAGLITQEKLEEEIEKIENGKRSPSLKALKRIADNIGMALKVEFVPKTSLAVG